MALRNRQKKVDVPAELQPYYAGDTPSGRRDWLVWGGRILGVLVIIFLIILLVHWAWHENHTGSKESHKPGTSQQHKTPQNKTPKSSNKGGSSQQGSGANDNSSSNGSTGTGSGGQQAPSPNGGSGSQPSSPQSSSSAPSEQSLTNTGPGEVIAVFFVTAIAGATVYQYRLRQKAQKS